MYVYIHTYIHTYICIYTYTLLIGMRRTHEVAPCDSDHCGSVVGLAAATRTFGGAPKRPWPREVFGGALCGSATRVRRLEAQHGKRRKSITSGGRIGKNRTGAQLKKGLRDRISPTCTLSQNGYGDLCWAWGVTPFVAGGPPRATTQRPTTFRDAAFQTQKIRNKW